VGVLFVPREDAAVAAIGGDIDLARDRALVEQFQLGDAEAFDRLYRQYFWRLHRFCHARLDDAYEAEDVAQEAFTRALPRLSSLGGERRFYSWMTVIAANLCTDALRRRVRTSLLDEVDAESKCVDDETSDDRDDAVDAALARLIPRHREVLHLREGLGWTCRQIADQFGIQVGTAEVLLWRARGALRREYQEMLVGR
jgi:RNA polymerase sigma-70 factor (ECF subfamily)